MTHTAIRSPSVTGPCRPPVMPHVVYLHSALTQDRIRPRDEQEARRLFRSRRDLMGVLVNHWITTVVGWASAAVIVILNVLLIYTTLGGAIPGLS